MRTARITEWLVRRPFAWLCALAIFIVAFIALLCLTGPNPNTTLRHAISLCLGFLTTTNSPGDALTGYPGWVRVCGWLTAVLGWLVVPIIVGASVAQMLDDESRRQQWMCALEQLGRELGYRDEQLREFVRQGLQVREDMILSGK